MRTTLDLDGSVLAALKERQRREGKTLGALASELLAKALADGEPSNPAFAWRSAVMGAKVDLEDAEAVRRALEDGR